MDDTRNLSCRSGKFLRKFEQVCETFTTGFTTGSLLSFPIAASVLVALLAMWMYHSCSYACLSVAVTLAAAAAQPRLPVIVTCVLGAISWVACFGGFALFASAGLGLAYVSLECLQDVDRLKSSLFCTFSGLF